MLKEINQTEKQILYNLTYICHLKQEQQKHPTQIKFVFTGDKACGEGDWMKVVKRYNLAVEGKYRLGV